MGDCLTLQPHGSWNFVLDDDCPQAMPFRNQETDQLEVGRSTDHLPALGTVLLEHQKVFKSQVGLTHVTEHIIDTGDAARVKVPSHPILFHYQD